MVKKFSVLFVVAALSMAQTSPPEQVEDPQKQVPQVKKVSPPKATPPPVIIAPPRPEPAPVPVPENAKSEDQKVYERKMQTRFDEAVAKIREFETKLEVLDREGKDVSWRFLQTAQGNRSVARTKLKQLRFVSPNQWFSLQSGIDKAFSNLDVSIDRLAAYAQSLATPPASGD